MNQRNKVVSSLKWKLFERISSQLVTFTITLVLARILSPGDYGVIALLSVFVSLATVFVQGGFNTALIQNQEVDNKDYSTVLYFSLFVALLIYGILFLISPVVASFYNQPILKSMLRVLALMLFFGAINSVQVAYVTKLLRFRALFKATIVSNVISGLLGVACAILGFGPWALVIQQVFGQIIICLIMFLMVEWRPTIAFSVERLRVLLKLGGKILASNLLVTLFLNIRSLIIGKVYTADELGFFDKGKQFPSTIMDAVNGTIQSVMLPVYSSTQDNLSDLKAMVRRSVQVSCYVVFPMMIGLACVAKQLVLLLLTDKWAMCVPIIQLFALSYMCQPIQTISAQAIKAIGDGSTILRIEIARKITEMLLLFISLKFGIIWVAASSVISGVISCFISFKPNKSKLNYSYKEQLADVSVPLIYSVVVGIVVYFAGFICSNNFMSAIIQVLLGVCTYIVISVVFKNKTFHYLLDSVKSYFRLSRDTKQSNE